MALTRTQITHAQLRITQAKNAFVAKKIAALGKRPDVDDYSDAEKLDFIRSGQATFIATHDRYCHITQVFTYPVLGKHVEQQAARDAWDDATSAIGAEAKRIESALLDQLIMSPDGSAALARIAEAFAA